ncbi:MAG: WxcM-like domain-containing protein [Magnetococcales bacterium]|nr:WxcM-like domain-containing protein [Magnetococcales bacterium]
MDVATNGVLVEPGVWNTLYDFSDDSLVLVLASLPHDRADYIVDYDAFLRLARERRQG